MDESTEESSLLSKHKVNYGASPVNASKKTSKVSEKVIKATEHLKKETPEKTDSKATESKNETRVLYLGMVRPTCDCNLKPPKIKFNEKDGKTEMWFDSTWMSVNTQADTYLRTGYRMFSTFCLHVCRMILKMMVMNGSMEYSQASLKKATKIITEIQKSVTTVTASKMAVSSDSAFYEMQHAAVIKSLNKKKNVKKEEIDDVLSQLKNKGGIGMELSAGYNTDEEDSTASYFIHMPCSTEMDRLQYYEALEDENSAIYRLSQQIKLTLVRLYNSNNVYLSELTFYTYVRLVKITDIILDQHKLQYSDMEPRYRNSIISFHIMNCCDVFFHWIVTETTLNGVLLGEAFRSVEYYHLNNSNFQMLKNADNETLAKISKAQQEMQLSNNNFRKCLSKAALEVKKKQEEKKKAAEAKERQKSEIIAKGITAASNNSSSGAVLVLDEDGKWVQKKETEDDEDSSGGCLIS